MKAKNIPLYIISFLIIISIVSCSKNQSAFQKAEDSITEADLERHISTLASDEFQGRKPFTDGEKKSIEYIKAEFKKMVKAIRDIELALGNGIKEPSE